MNRPEEVVQFINRDIVDVCVSCGHFITAFYTVIDPAQKKMLYTSAGHEPPLLIKEGGSYRHLDKTQLLMGVDKNVDYVSVRVSINSDDVIVLFSDGITEAADAEQRMFERERLRDSVKKSRAYSAKEIVHHVFQDLRDFLQGSPLTDDFTLAVMKVIKAN